MLSQPGPAFGRPARPKNTATTTSYRRPRFVVTGRLRPPPGRERRSGWAVCTRRSGQIRPMRLLPRMRFVAFLRRWRVDGVMEPAVPGRWHRGGFRVAVIDHPAALEAERLVDLAAAGPIVPVAELVLADGLAIHPGPELRPEGLRIPPGERFEQETFHRRRALNPVATRAFCHLTAALSSESMLKRLDFRPYLPHRHE